MRRLGSVMSRLRSVLHDMYVRMHIYIHTYMHACILYQCICLHTYTKTHLDATHFL
jgi:hypothetical protein